MSDEHIKSFGDGSPFPPFSHQSFGAWLQHYRGMQNLTQEELAEQTGFSARTIRSWESGRIPGHKNLFKVATTCALPADLHQAFVDTFGEPRTYPHMGDEEESWEKQPSSEISLPPELSTDGEQINTQRFRSYSYAVLAASVGVMIVAVILVIGAYSREAVHNTQQSNRRSASLIAPVFEAAVSVSRPPTPTPDSLETLMEQKTHAEAVLGTALRWPRVFHDTFDTNAHQWILSDTLIEDDYGNDQLRLEDGVLFLDAVSHTPDGALIWNTHTILPDYEDFYLSVDIACVVCSDRVSPVILFRTYGEQEAESFYFVRLNFDQTLNLAKQPAFQSPQRLTRMAAPTIRREKHVPNQLDLVMQDDHMSVFVNDVYVTDVHDADFQQGTIYFGVFIPDAQHATVAFDNLEIRTP